MLGIALGYDPSFYFSGSLTTIGAAAGATLIDTKITRFDRTRPVNKWIYLTSGAISGESQRVSTVSDDTVGTITPVRAFTAQVASGVTYEILPFAPDDMHNALQEAGRVINEDSPLFLPNETLVVDNLISNWDFETFAAGAFTGWSSVGAPTLTQETSLYVHGSNAASIAGAASIGIKQDIIAAAGGFYKIQGGVGKTLHVRGFLRSPAANSGRLRVTFDGSTYTNGPYHAGGRGYEGPPVHAIDVTIPSGPTEMTVSVEKSTADALVTDVVVAWIDPIYRYTVPTAFVFPSPTHVYQQVNPVRPNGDYAPLTLENPAVAGRILRLEGYGRLTVPTTDAGTVELDETRAELLIAEAAAILTGEAKWLAKAAALKAASSVARQTELNHVNRNNPWQVRDESGTSYLLLSDR